MSKRQDGNGQIPIPLIIFGYFLSPPVGVVLTLLKVFTDRKAKTAGSEKEEVSDSGGVKKHISAAEKTGSKDIKRSGMCVPAFVLSIIAAVFMLCGVLNAADMIFKYPLQEFLQYGLPDTLILLVMAGACVIPAGILKKRHDRQNVIRSIIGRRETMQMAQLAAAADLSPKKLRKELQAMIDKGEFGDEAFIDLSTGRFMRHPDELEEKLRASAENNPKQPEQENSDPAAESDKFRSIILQIRKLNDDIKDYAVSERIYRIEEHTQNIFDYVTAHPEAMSQIRSFMNYYLPTTLKLLDSYSRIEQVGVAGENMKKSKENIERILDMLVVGFEQQVDQLFRNESMDISSEITVLEAMMKQDGLDGRSDFDPGFSDELTDGSAAAQTAPKTE